LDFASKILGIEILGLNRDYKSRQWELLQQGTAVVSSITVISTECTIVVYFLPSLRLNERSFTKTYMMRL